MLRAESNVRKTPKGSGMKPIGLQDQMDRLHSGQGGYRQVEKIHALTKATTKTLPPRKTLLKMPLPPIQSFRLVITA